MTEVVVERLSVERRGRRILSELSLSLLPERPVVLVGPNGAGKSTLLSCILGLVTPTEGCVRLAGQDVQTLSAARRASLVAWLPQRNEFEEPITVADYVATARYRFRETKLARARQVMGFLGRIQAEALADRELGSLSGGERQRVELAALLAQEARLLLLDEPANHLDPLGRAQSYRLLFDALPSGVALLMVSHDLNLFGSLCKHQQLRVVGLRDGHLAFDSELDSPRLESDLSDLYGVPMAVFDWQGQRVVVPRIVGEAKNGEEA